MKPKTELLINFFVYYERGNKEGLSVGFKETFYGVGVGVGVALVDGIVLLPVNVEFRMVSCILSSNCIVELSPLKVCVTVLTVYTTTKQDRTTVDVTNSSAATVDSKASPPFSAFKLTNNVL